jgi:hypothetical protein
VRARRRAGQSASRSPTATGDGIPDRCEIAGGAADHYGPTTCVPDGIPDVCQPQPDCDNDGIPDRCEIAGGAADNYGPTTCVPDGIPTSASRSPTATTTASPTAARSPAVRRTTTARRRACPDGIPDSCQPQPDCDGDGIPDRCEIAGGAADHYGRTTCLPTACRTVCQPQPDCDTDGIPDRCEIAGGATDCDGDGLPDVCEPDCNQDGTIDDCEVDCNNDNIPDECQQLVDCDGNGTPDVCELAGHDCNSNGILDVCEPDCNGNLIPDDCDIANDPGSDQDHDGELDVCQCRPIDRHRPGSLLLFPKFDNRQAQRTLLTVTNVHPSLTVDVHFVFRSETTCLEFDYNERLTPKDTVTLLTSTVNPSHDQGYVYAYAVSTQTGQAIVHNHLIGQSMSIQGIGTFDYALDAVSFLGIGDGVITDLDGDGRRDLNGEEYEEAPDELLIPRFLGQTALSSSEIVLVDLTGGPAFSVVVDFFVYNDNEEGFSGQHAFTCWSACRCSRCRARPTTISCPG